MLAAIAFADEFGIATLTLRALGTSVGATTTAIYRYFQDKDDLIVAMRESLLNQIAPPNIDSNPRARIVALALGFRSTAKDHPCLSQIMQLSAVEGEQTGAIIALLFEMLSDLGLTGPLLARGHRQLESFVVGSTAFDFSGAPNHLSTRLARLIFVNNKTILQSINTESDVETVNEAAFVTSLNWIIDGLIAESSVQK